MKISIHPDFPKAYEKEVRANLERLTPFIEPLVQELRVYYEQNGSGEASINVLRRYHSANLSLNSAFFSQESEERTTVLCHEVAHVLINPIGRELDHIVEFFFESEDLRGYLAEKTNDAVEKSVDSVGRALYQVLLARVDKEG